MRKFLINIVLAVATTLAFIVPNIANADTVAAAGTFKGASDHITTGGVSVIKTSNGGAVVILDRDFSLDGAPDPRVGFGKDGKFVAATDLGPLTQKTGLQVYVVPAGINIADFNEVYIWCRKFSVPLGVATIK